MRESTWAGEPTRLDRVLAEAGLARSRTQAAELIDRDEVRVNGASVTKASLRIVADDIVAVTMTERYVSRAAYKLVAGLDEFDIDPAGRIALDLGASTGGFSQVLVERGATAVQAIDVGHGQLAPELLDEPRIRLVEGRNARELDAENLAHDTGIAEPPTLVVADLSFISLRLIFPAIAKCAAADADLVLLVKPQFEVGRVRDGIVTNPVQWGEALRVAITAAAENGFAVRGLAHSPITGGHGNREFLTHFTRDNRGNALDQTEWEARIAALCADPNPATLVDPRTAERNETE
ncbi:23S rRNA (cytidine1920-2'-O)/16S rRNA (cytidine1409-2'-O)-methyltransferase [Leucobacter exalbidus]|uniref:23S rRNA (Cytidine1920-2'-O)/16S rRNA (Cytidine1409-2'-O)-methyltransferase n=1 Tax=Leucobacter exalbidus TaxID=662960 RepID=A0A940PVF9_9MICO|nr:TlyA family RNA methyltransferase [Leucobacter exalbidus]MBP1325941.1 23S rRNA (cytidine1920-2'-O)/16S rRNA (cytidine1409-2'-O)-methyltransferase [Leucobacter exalbidus]